MLGARTPSSAGACAARLEVEGIDDRFRALRSIAGEGARAPSI